MAWAPDYLEVEELADYLRIADDADDDLLAAAIGASSRMIDAHCNRQFGKVAAPEERRYRAYRRGSCWAADIDDLMSTSGLVVETGSGAVTGYELEPFNAAQNSRPWTRLVLPQSATGHPTDYEPWLDITAPWGWTTVPPAVTLACRLQSSRFHARRDSPYGVAGSPDQGNELRLLARLDPDVAVMLRAVRRPRKVG
jgi:hypothetical protein